MRYLFLGTPAFAATVLESFAGEFGAPVAVVTQPARPSGRGRKLQPSEVQVLAESRGWEVLAVPNINEAEVIERLQGFQPDLILVAAFGQILREPILKMPKRYCLNVHTSLLPRWRGAAPVNRAILAGDTHTGVTIQKMAKKLDTGAILLQRETEILDGDTGQTLLDRLAVEGGLALREGVKHILAGKESFREQNEAETTYAHKLAKEEGQLDWNRTAAELDRAVRGLQPWPLTETKIGTERVKIFRAKRCETRGNAGEVQSDGKTFLRVGCGDSYTLEILELQAEGRRRVSIGDYLRGLRTPLPNRL